MAEQIDLQAPYGPQTTSWQVHSITLERGLAGDVLNPARSFIAVHLYGSNGQRFSHLWSGSDADAMIVALNKANLGTISLMKRIFNRLLQDGVVVGTVVGAVE